MPDSNFIVYVDESGDHGLVSIDPDYPIFVLLFCLCRKDEYATQLVPNLTRFKFKHFGHDQVILHEHEIRKASPPFAFLVNRARREVFMQDLDSLVRAAPVTLIASVIKKRNLQDTYIIPENPYNLAMEFGLERLAMHLRGLGEHRTTHVVFECRGKKEDAALELEFRRICDGRNALHERLPFQIVFADKKSNSSGLQMADLLARPIGRHVLNPTQPNRAYDALETKFRRRGDGKLDGWGLKCFP
ncbi:MAG: DUF3800 domain-containing protein [Gemmatimonadota bacterium]